MQRLEALLTIPSVSAAPAHAADVVACADLLVKWLLELGFAARKVAGKKHPLVVAHSPRRAGTPQVLFYGHYDVQPVEPVSQWHTPPFTPTLRDGRLYARGSSDDKGQIWAFIEAVRGLGGAAKLPYDLHIVLEGEEEIGSLSLKEFLATHRDELVSDWALICDTAWHDARTPTIITGLRGLVYQEITVHGARADLHSGTHGGGVLNPATVLCRILAAMHDELGTVTIPGFYDKVVPPSPAELADWARLGFSEAEFLAELGLSADSGGERKLPILHRRWARPTFEINGLTAGHQGPGAKTVIGAVASAKVSMRLVAHQDPEVIREAFVAYVRKLAPASVRVEIIDHSSAPASLVSAAEPCVLAAIAALEQGTGLTPARVRDGGSIPAAAWIQDLLAAPVVLMGFGLPDDALHAPNEKMDMLQLQRAVDTLTILLSTPQKR